MRIFHRLGVVYYCGRRSTSVGPVAPVANPAVASDSSTGLVERIRAAKTAYRADAMSEVESRQAKLRQAIAECKPCSPNLGVAVETGWKNYLHWTHLESGVNEPEKVEPYQLQAIVERFSRNHQGLELPRFTNVRDRLRAYARALEGQRAGKADELYNQALEDWRNESHVINNPLPAWMVWKSPAT